ncbi:MAG: response regulator [Anaerolineales bacterium]|nr:MAG: response regulator [Anaerolineales bacterium]
MSDVRGDEGGKEPPLLRYPLKEIGCETMMSIDPTDAYVLVVEDNVHSYVLIARLLAFLGVKHQDWKRSGWQVLEFADAMPRVDLILMDIHLPYEDGYEALSKLRAHPRFADTLIVAVTAEATVSNMKRARSAGFNGFIGKPIDPDRFIDQVRVILRNQPVWDLGISTLSIDQM